MRLILVVALLCFLSPISYAVSITAARTYCADIAEAGTQLAQAKENGAAKHALVERAHKLFQDGEFSQAETSAILWVIDYVYKSEETHETIRQPMFKACMKELGYSGA